MFIGGNYLVINCGSNDGIKDSTWFEIRDGPPIEIIDPDTKEVLFKWQYKKHILKIVKMYSNYSVCLVKEPPIKNINILSHSQLESISTRIYLYEEDDFPS